MVAKYLLQTRGSTYGAIAGFTFLALIPIFLSDFHVSLLAKFLCFAIVAISIDLIWGYAGILSIGHGVFFGIGAYAFGMYLKLEVLQLNRATRPAQLYSHSTRRLADASG